MVVGAMGGWLLGLALGVRHAFDPDHLTAVSTLVVEHRSASRGAWLGLFWGLGHTASLLAVALLLAAFDAQLPASFSNAFELCVALMLVALGVRSIALSLGPRSHGHAHAAVDPPRWRFAGRSVVVGLVHGLAGSGGLTVLVLAGLPSTTARLAYLTVFGVGSVLGMAAVSGLAGWPLAHLGRSRRLGDGLLFATGAWSTLLGIAWGVPLLGAG